MVSKHYYRLRANLVTLRREPHPEVALEDRTEEFDTQLHFETLQRQPVALSKRSTQGPITLGFWFGPHCQTSWSCQALAERLASWMRTSGYDVLLADSWWRDGRNWEQGGGVQFRLGTADIPAIKRTLKALPRFPLDQLWSGNKAEVEAVLPSGGRLVEAALSIRTETYQGRRGACSPKYYPGEDRVFIGMAGALQRGFAEAMLLAPPARGGHLTYFDASYAALPWLSQQLTAEDRLRAKLTAIVDFVGEAFRAPDLLAELYDDY